MALRSGASKRSASSVRTEARVRQSRKGLRKQVYSRVALLCQKVSRNRENVTAAIVLLNAPVSCDCSLLVNKRMKRATPFSTLRTLALVRASSYCRSLTAHCERSMRGKIKQELILVFVCSFISCFIWIRSTVPVQRKVKFCMCSPGHLSFFRSTARRMSLHLSVCKK